MSFGLLAQFRFLRFRLFYNRFYCQIDDEKNLFVSFGLIMKFMKQRNWGGGGSLHHNSVKIKKKNLNELNRMEN